ETNHGVERQEAHRLHEDAAARHVLSGERVRIERRRPDAERGLDSFVLSLLGAAHREAIFIACPSWCDSEGESGSSGISSRKPSSSLCLTRARILNHAARRTSVNTSAGDPAATIPAPASKMTRS